MKESLTLRQHFRRFIRRNMPYLVVCILLSMLVFVYCFDRIFVTVHSGEVGVKYRRFAGGTVIDHPYGEGLHVIFPWDTLYIYNVRNQVVSHQFEALSKHGLPLTISLTIRYRPEYQLVGLLHQQVGPDYVARIVTPEVDAKVREIVGNYRADEVYSTDRSIIQKIINEALEQGAQRFVVIDDVLITRIELPQQVREAIEAKLVEEQKSLSYEYILAREEKEAKRKLIEARGISDYQAVVASTLTEELLTEKGIRATRELAASQNSKVVVIGGGNLGLPLILGGETARAMNSEAMVGDTPVATKSPAPEANEEAPNESKTERDS